ncbi:translation initiation factor IF-2-like [Mesocricetus auratus]|uniref:Translation initiation factor IF-2-like n=1 Tax=Mesocricetus auratus TaxID=10036 RepID=A0ABM2WIV0_MESAU|nr:translation initiation factor IF-2-like [Mesocricetus auratus]
MAQQPVPSAPRVFFSAPPASTSRPAETRSRAAAPPRATPGRLALPQSPDPAPSPPRPRRSRPRPARRPRARSPTWRRGHERGGGWGGCGPGPHSGRAARPPGAIFARQARAAPPPHEASRAGPGTLSRPTPYGPASPSPHLSAAPALPGGPRSAGPGRACPAPSARPSAGPRVRPSVRLSAPGRPQPDPAGPQGAAMYAAQHSTPQFAHLNDGDNSISLQRK